MLDWMIVIATVATTVWAGSAGIIFYLSHVERDAKGKRFGARMLLTLPIWPLALAVVIVIALPKGVARLIDTAELTRGVRR